MAKEQTTNEQQLKEQSIKLKAKILLRNYVKEDTKDLVDYVSVELPDAFGDEDYVDIPIAPKWKDADSVFKFYARKALKTTDELEFPVEIKVLSYLSKKTKKKVYYPGIVGVSPFNGRELEFRVKSESNQAIFDELARNIFGLRKDPDEYPE